MELTTISTLQATPLFSDGDKIKFANFLQIIYAQKQSLLQQSQLIFQQRQQISALFSQITNLQQQQLNNNTKFENYATLMIGDLVKEFVNTYTAEATKQTYTQGFKKLFEQGFLYPDMSLSTLKTVNLEKILDDIRQQYKAKINRNISEASESTRQLRAAMLISFSTFLCRRTEGYIHRIAPNKFGGNKTFRFRREKTKASPLTREQINNFLISLRSFSERAYLFASLQLIGARRVSEVIQLQIEDLDFENNRVHFKLLKTRGLELAPIPIYLPPKLCADLKSFVKDRKRGFVFTSSTDNRNNNNNHHHHHHDSDLDSCKSISKGQVVKLYHRGWLIAHKNSMTNPMTTFKPQMVTHSLRAAGISYLFDQGIDSQLIKRITGHKSADMVSYYDTKSRFDNISKNVYIFDLC